MNLDYPSEKKQNLTEQLNSIDRKFGSIILSNPKISASKKQIPSNLKKKVLRFISLDDSNRLLCLYEDQAVCVHDEISKDGLGWNSLHFIAKSNSLKCLDACLRKMYQDDPKVYMETLNSRTSQGDSPLLIACHYKSIETVKMILDYGGADISIINSKKQTAYQIALSSGSQEALQVLMKYELKLKKRNSMNLCQLQEPVRIEREKRCWACFCSIWEKLCGEEKEEGGKEKKDTETDRKMVKQMPSDFVGDFEIFWLDPENFLEHSLPLFHSVSSPFALKQSNVIVSHLFLIFQVLAEHPDLLKSIIFHTESKYYVKFHHNMEEKIVWVDGIFPFFHESNQPLFISLDDQLWPMVLQKALCQYYNGYFQAGKIPLTQLLHTIAGNHCFQKKLTSTDSDKIQIKALISELLNSEYMHILEPTAECPLKTEEGRIQCFSILKSHGESYLINCPFVATSDIVKQSREGETREMKLLKSHYNNSSTMVVWISYQELTTYFEQIIFCDTNSSPNKAQVMKLSLCGNRIFINFKSKDMVEKSGFSFYFLKSENGEPIIPKSVAGWSAKGSKKQKVEKIMCHTLGNVKVDCLQGNQELLFMCEFEQCAEAPLGEMNLVYRNNCIKEAEALDPILGDLQFIEHCKKYFNENHESFCVPIIETIGEYVLIMVASEGPCYIPLNDLDEENIVEGLMTENGGKLEMFRYGEIQFAVLMNVGASLTDKLEIFSYEGSTHTHDTDE